MFDEHKSLHKLRHYLPAQASLKDFVHHNTLHAFQHHKFHDGLLKASKIFGYRTYLSLDEFRSLYASGKIKEEVLDRVLADKLAEHYPGLNGEAGRYHQEWKHKLLNQECHDPLTSRIGHLRKYWKAAYQINLDKVVHPFLFRLLSAYLDQGISIWPFPASGKGLLSSLREMQRNGLTSLFKTGRAADILMEATLSMKDLLAIVVGDETLFEHYLFDQQFAHPGWAGMVAVIEEQPETLLDNRVISLHDLIYLELLLEIDALDHKFGINWRSLWHNVKEKPEPIFAPTPATEVYQLLAIWQEAFEWSYFDDVMAGIQHAEHKEEASSKSFQALFCIDDREYSLRRYVELADPRCQTYGTPGFFGVEFFFQPENGKFHTKACPAPVTPRFLVREEGRRNEQHTADAHYMKHSHRPLMGWLITQTLGFWSALRLFVNVFKPSLSPATAYSFRHMDKHSRLSIDSTGEQVDGLQVGFGVEEMATRVGNTLRSIGLVEGFAPLVYLVGHGASSVNNTHYAGYDCGACCGRPGAVNARVFSYMANKPAVRELLRQQGLDIPDSTYFLGGMHDTTRDEIEFYDEGSMPSEHLALHEKNKGVFDEALRQNARERARRFDTIDIHQPLARLHRKVKRRSVSLFEPRPELNHATNALCVVGRGSLTRKLFLDRRPFMNSYDYRVDPEGKLLLTILNAAAPVCGGINLEYYFSRVDQEKLGAGTKLPHNVVGLFAVSNGVEGDLRPGLPSQMIEVHDPIRILFVIEHDPEVVLKTIRTNPATYEWFINEWVLLAVKDPVSGRVYRFRNGQLDGYIPLRAELAMADDVLAYITAYSDNIPVLLNHE